jgi:hypothetical protein
VVSVEREIKIDQMKKKGNFSFCSLRKINEDKKEQLTCKLGQQLAGVSICLKKKKVNLVHSFVPSGI